MTGTITFALGALALLATPGPTNTLLATAGATKGIRASLPLLLGEAAGYLAAIVILRTLVGPLIAAEPLLTQVLSGLICLYLVYLAARLWRSSGLPLDGKAHIGVFTVFLTTLFNPKAIVFAFTLLPASLSLAGLLPWLGALIALIAVCGSAWITLGATLATRAGAGPNLGFRAGAIALLVLAVVVGTRAAGLA